MDEDMPAPMAIHRHGPDRKMDAARGVSPVLMPQLKALQAAWKAEETATNQTKDTRSAVAGDVIKAIEAAN
jgi:hypothetical protein